MLKTTLKQLGLTDKEIKIYLALLPLGQASASVLAYRTKIGRTTTRYVCEQLVKKRLLSANKSGSTFIYSAEPPEKILYLLEQDKQALATKEAKVNRIIGDLKLLANPETMLPKVRLYEGATELRRVYEDTLLENETIYAFANVDAISPEIRDFVLSDYVPRRIEKGIFAEVITPDNPTNRAYREQDEQRLRETKFFDQKIFPLEVEINIYGNKVAFFSYKKEEMFGAIFESSAMASSMKAIFDLCWKLAK